MRCSALLRRSSALATLALATLALTPGTGQAAGGATATVTSPSAGQHTSEGVADLVATASSPYGVSAVEFRLYSALDGSLVTTTYGDEAPAGTFTAALDTTQVAEGAYDVRAVAVDGNAVSGAESAPVRFDVDNCSDTATLYDPVDGDEVHGPVRLVVGSSASGCGFSSKLGIDYYLDGVFHSFSDEQAEDGSWGADLDTLAVPNGTHTLRVAADDGNAGPLSDPVSFVVNNVAPTVTWTGPAWGTRVTGSAVELSADAAADAATGKAVDYVAFFQDGLLVDTAYDAPYAVDWDTTKVGVGPHEITATAYDTDGMEVTTPSVQLSVYAPTSVALTTSTTALTYSQGATVRATVLRADGSKAPVAGRSVQLLSRKRGTSAWSPLAKATTSGSGVAAFTVRPAGTTEYSATVASDDLYTGSTSATRAISVRTKVTARLSAAAVPLGRTVTLSGAVAPSHAGAPVTLQRLVSGTWRNVTNKALNGSSAFSFAVRPTARGTYSYRVAKPADSDHLVSWSGVVTLRVT